MRLGVWIFVASPHKQHPQKHEAHNTPPINPCENMHPTMVNQAQQVEDNNPFREDVLLAGLQYIPTKLIHAKERIEQPSDLDVIIGGTKVAAHHPGNRVFQETLMEFLDDHIEAKTKPKKRRMILFIIQFMRDVYGARFLQLDQRSGTWVEVEERVAKETVTKSLRELRKEAKKSRRRPKGKEVEPLPLEQPGDEGPETETDEEELQQWPQFLEGLLTPDVQDCHDNFVLREIFDEDIAC